MGGDIDVWKDRVLSVLDTAPAGKTVNQQKLLTMIAARFAAKFEAGERDSMAGEPMWWVAVSDALSKLRDDGLVVQGSPIELTALGRSAAPDAIARATAYVPTRGKTTATGAPGRLPIAGVIAPPLRASLETRRSGHARAAEAGTASPAGADDPISVMVELNSGYGRGFNAAFNRLKELWKLVAAAGTPYRLTDEYATGRLAPDQIEGLVAADAVASDISARAMQRIWPDFEIHGQIDQSFVTIKAEAAQRSFNAYGEGIVWAVVDSGIDRNHPHFLANETLTHPSVRDLHRTCPGDGPPVRDGALLDEEGHGTHVAGIIAGGLNGWAKKVVVTENRYNTADGAELRRRTVVEPARLSGIAPRARLVSLKVLGAKGNETARVGRVIQALSYVRRVNAASDNAPRIHGVNLSLGYGFDPAWYACGSSPLCIAVDNLVRSGVIVVVAAGNSAYVSLFVEDQNAPTRFSTGMTINDPGNAKRAVTVGSTHRDAPHTYGISYFSSRGPTGDGRMKPDLVAPGERITSAAAGALGADAFRSLGRNEEGAAVYIEQSGTSMAAPHVSGAIAAFLSVRREFISDPESVKRIFVESATPLGRDRYLEGGGLVDLMRALQSV
ncbi:S8 family peptidase [Nocardia pseudovaccinii]|uniref:S8 family peptidase n=1 Tax=Nocardia pseudovaccinii TaxID=189540 RepID=UPI0007A5015C|nr:S8 family peptidase [Nocardia pseudovaccinii]